MQLSLLPFLSLFRSRTTAKVHRQKKGSDEFLLSIWLNVRKEFFPDRPDIDEVEILWSRRKQKRVLASVSIKQKKVRVASELNHPEHYQWLEPLLYHEMCHSILGENIPVRNRKRQWHGHEFKKLEQQHPKMKAFEHWIKTGGWAKAVRSARTRTIWIHRRAK
jgi:hypothetical protein